MSDIMPSLGGTPDQAGADDPDLAAGRRLAARVLPGIGSVMSCALGVYLLRREPAPWQGVLGAVMAARGLVAPSAAAWRAFARCRAVRRLPRDRCGYPREGVAVVRRPECGEDPFGRF